MKMTPEEKQARADQRKALREEKKREDADRPAQLVQAVQAYFCLKDDLEASSEWILFNHAKETVDRLLRESGVQNYECLIPLGSGEAQFTTSLGLFHCIVGQNEFGLTERHARYRITTDGAIDRTWEQHLLDERQAKWDRERKAEQKARAKAEEKATYERLQAKYGKKKVSA
jgi:hypothetical protein